MKRMIAIAFMIALICTPALAEDTVLDLAVQSSTTQLDKNGNEYVRFICEEARTINGINYDSTVAVMAFGPLAIEAKSKLDVKQLKAIAEKRQYQGRTSYTILKFLE